MIERHISGVPVVGPEGHLLGMVTDGDLYRRTELGTETTVTQRAVAQARWTITVTKPVAGGAQIDGFAATTHVSTMVQGEYTAQVTRQLPPIAGAPGVASQASKQALIGALSTPSFLAPIK